LHISHAPKLLPGRSIGVLILNGRECSDSVFTSICGNGPEMAVKNKDSPKVAKSGTSCLAWHIQSLLAARRCIAIELIDVNSKARG